MRSKPKLPQGWSWPLTATEIEQRFPGVARTTWSLGRLGPFRGTFYVATGEWSPRSMAATPGLTVHAIPSEHRRAIREALTGHLGEQIAEWFADIPHRPETWLSENQGAAWRWQPTGGDP